MTASPEKAAPIPAEVQTLAGRIYRHCQSTPALEAIAIIERLLVADRASQGERIREDERAEGADEADIIIAAGRKMAARIGAEFVIDPQKLADFRARRRGDAS